MNTGTRPPYKLQTRFLRRKIKTDLKTHSDTCCDTEQHVHHLCYVLSQGLNLTDPDEYQALINRPAFKCNHCGREANSAGNVCVPVDLD